MRELTRISNQTCCRHICRKLYITGKHHSTISTQSANIGWMPAVSIIHMLAFEVLRLAIRIAACHSKNARCTLLLLVAMRHLRFKRNCKQENYFSLLVIKDINELNSVNWKSGTWTCKFPPWWISYLIPFNLAAIRNFNDSELHKWRQLNQSSLKVQT